LEGRPNILLILADDLGYGDVNLGLTDIEVFNNPHIKTPNLAELATESLVLTHHYSASPVCSPARAGLLTGRTPTRCNINRWISDMKDNRKYFLHGDEITIAELLRDAGYETAIFGKWHLNGMDWEVPENWTGASGSFPKQQGFNHGFAGKEDPHVTRELRINTQKHPGDYFTVDGKPLGTMKGYSSQLISNGAMDWLENRRDPNKPFFLYLPYDAVHIRISSPDVFEQMYQTDDPNKDFYYANVTHLDHEIGRLLDYMEEARLDENTIVIFASDNGPDIERVHYACWKCLGTSYPLYGQKQQLFEGGIRVPGMVRWPDRIRPGISDEPNGFVDVLPTLCEAVGIEPPTDRELDGTSILDHLTEGVPVDRPKPLYWQYEYPAAFEMKGEGYNRRFDGQRRIKGPKPSVSIRDGDYVLLGLQEERFQMPTDFLLYNVVEDVEQQHDLSTAEPNRLERMKQKMANLYQTANEERLHIEAKVQELYPPGN
jgi:arylsulfatase A